MQIVNIHKAKTQLSKLVEMAAKGEPFIIAKAGKPMVKVMPLDTPIERKPQRTGCLQGQFEVPEDFDTMFSDEIIRMFEGKED